MYTNSTKSERASHDLLTLKRAYLGLLDGSRDITESPPYSLEDETQPRDGVYKIVGLNEGLGPGEITTKRINLCHTKN